MQVRHFVIALGIALAGCSASGANGAAKPTAAAQAVHAISGLPVVPLSVSQGNMRHVFRVEVARSPAEQARGLMHRVQMGPDEGMIFPMDPPRPASFWMRNTVLALDIIFVGTDGRVINIAANAVPYDETPLPSAAPVKGVLELNAGRAAALGIEPGAKVEW